MFCPSCGIEYTVGLNYCNRCGANLSLTPGTNAEVVPLNVTKPTLIIGVTLLMLTLGGFAGLISGAIEMAKTVGGKGLITGAIEMARAVGGGDLSMALVFLGMVTILIVDVSLVRQLSKLINASISSHNLPQPRKAPSLFQKFSRPSTGRLEPAPSVTENTTRFFERPHASPELKPQKIADEFKN